MVSHVTANGESIYEVILSLENAVEGYPRTHIIIALLALAIQTQKPSATFEEVQEGVKSVSEWLCAYLDTENDEIKH